jgi:hypothetical protein
MLWYQQRLNMDVPCKHYHKNWLIDLFIHIYSYGTNVGKTIINHPPAHPEVHAINKSQTGGLLLFYRH